MALPRIPLPGTGGTEPRSRPRRRPRAARVTEVTRPAPEHVQPIDYADESAVFSTGPGAAETYHYHRQATFREQYANQVAPQEAPRGEVSPV